MLQMQNQNSLACSIASLPVSQRKSIIEKLTDEEANALLYDWSFWARKEQLPPEEAWTIWLLLSGRGFGKTRTGAEWVLDRVRKGYRVIALVGQAKADVRDTMVELGDSSIMKISPPWDMPNFEPSKRRLTWKNGAIAIIYSGDESDQLRGPQHDSAWVDELAKFKYPQETWDNLSIGCRIGADPRIVVTTTPRPLPIIKALIKEKGTVVTRGSTYDNVANLSRVFMERILSKYEGTRLARQEIKGEILEDVPGALWTLTQIEAHRVHKTPQLTRIVIGIDPEATSSENSAETGIVAAGIGSDGHGYVLSDETLRATPHIWAEKAIWLYKKLKADRIIAETNQGGEMVENTIRTIDANVSYLGIRATRGKITRAEPISALYEQGKIHHVGSFPELEDQMCSYVPGEKSPDRMDALVWAFTELFLNENIPEPYEEPYEVEEIE